MSDFPALKTSAIAQYPATKTIEFQNQTVRFLNGSEQRYRDCAGPLHRWHILLDQLDEAELAGLESFFLANQGAYASFEFVDPWDQVHYPNCSLVSDGMTLRAVEEMSGDTLLTVVENR